MKTIHSNILIGGGFSLSIGFIIYLFVLVIQAEKEFDNRLSVIDTLYHSPTCLLIKVGTGELGYKYRYKYITQGDCIVDNALMIP